MVDLCNVTEDAVGSCFEVVEAKGGLLDLRKLFSPVMCEVVIFADI